VSSSVSFAVLLESLPARESSHRFIRGPSTEIIITIMIKAGTTCCPREYRQRTAIYETAARRERERG